MAHISTNGDEFALASALVAANYLDTPQSVLDYFSKPWNYSPEFGLWDSLGRPGDRCDEGWYEFYDKLAELDEVA
jgi:hypothetical protein